MFHSSCSYAWFILNPLVPIKKPAKDFSCGRRKAQYFHILFPSGKTIVSIGAVARVIAMLLATSVKNCCVTTLTAGLTQVKNIQEI